MELNLFSIVAGLVLLCFAFFVPGFLTTNLFFKKYKGLEKIMVSIIISICIAIFFGLIISLLKQFRFEVIIAFYVLLNGGLYAKWIFQ